MKALFQSPTFSFVAAGRAADESVLLMITAGDRLLQLYAHCLSKALPVLMVPSEATCKDVALLSFKRQDWPLIVAAAQDVSATNAEQAAIIITNLVESLAMSRSSGSAVTSAAAGMPLRHAAGRYQDTVKVSLQQHAAFACILSPV